MENRRQNYRHLLVPRHNITVSFRTTDGTGSFTGEIVNLSIGGMRIKAEMKEAGPGKKWHATFTLDADEPPLRIPAEARVRPG